MDVVNALLGEQGSTEIQDELMKKLYENRVLLINADISDWLIEEVVMHILAWNIQDKDIPIEKRKKITLIISSEGGSVFSSNNLVDVILSSKTKIASVALDLCASAAFAIYIACDERIAFKHSSFMVHEDSRQISNTATRSRRWMDFMDDLSEIDKQLVMERTKITEEEYDKNYKDDFLFFADEAKQKGIVDLIIGEDIAIDEIF